MKEKKIHPETLKKDGFSHDLFIVNERTGHLTDEAKDVYVRGKDKLDPIIVKKIERKLSWCQKCAQDVNELKKKKTLKDSRLPFES